MMASPDRSKRKILKAKKTMPTSCRKQVEILNKSKNVEALKTTATRNNVLSSNQNFGTSVISSKCRNSENVSSSSDTCKNSVFSQKSKVFSQSLIQPMEETVDSEIRFEYINEQVVCPCQKPSKTDSPKKVFIQGTKDSRITSRNTSENHSKYQANITRSFFDHEGNYDLKSICCPHLVLSDVVQMPKSTVTNTLDDKRIDKVISHLETNSNTESHDKRQSDLILSSDSHFVPVEETPKLVNSVSSSNCTTDLKIEDSNRICHSSILNCKSRDSTWQSSLDADSSNSHNQKKRMFSENKENVKRVKTSEQINENICVALEKQTALLEQVKRLIRQEVDSVNYKLFDNKLKELNERIGKTQCRNKHEAIADELFTKIGKLQRRIETVLLSQRKSLETKILSRDTACKVKNLETTNLDKNRKSVYSPDERVTSMNCEPSDPSLKTHEKNNLPLGCDESISKSNDDVLLVSVESPNLTTPITPTPTEIRKITSGNSSNSPYAEAEVMIVEKNKLDSVIDLTKEDLSSYNTESPLILQSPLKTVINSKETTPVAPNAPEVLESFDHLPPLPEPPPALSELVDKVRDTLPPQKPELKVKRVLRPKGIALTWNITKINPKCAPVESYHLFLCHENSSNTLIWKKIGEIKALPLPMACTVSQFLTSNKYYFTVQSKDIFGRYGPFCDIKSIPGFSENVT
ncbi:activating transcription factor 7-interacting protein 2 isoform X2 [Tupaia chinensis]|nr:activating transcription factor 7-interacting protein 2 isoform X2 [Tupaia chinensis]XP_006146572.1 activating transcription factor 7-interacting protein 2 isoform X2 [Tupaia chinensis]